MFENCGSCIAAEQFVDIKSGQNDAKNTEGKQRMKKARNELLQFLGGLAMLIGGLFLFSQKVMVSSGFGMGFLLGGVRVASGLLIIPLIIGIVWLFASGGSMGSKIMIGVGVLIIIAGVIASTTIRLQTITLKYIPNLKSLKQACKVKDWSRQERI